MTAWFCLKHLESRLLPAPSSGYPAQLHQCLNCRQSFQLDQRVYQFSRLIRQLGLRNQCPHCGSWALQAQGFILH